MSAENKGKKVDKPTERVYGESLDQAPAGSQEQFRACFHCGELVDPETGCRGCRGAWRYLG